MGKVVIITGASSGIGKKTALKLIQDGHVVYGLARRIDKMNYLEGHGGHAIAMDVTDQASISLAVAQIIKEQGKIDVLFNNAGYAVYGAIEDVDLDEARHQFEVNLFGVAAITKEVLPIMRKQGSGTIVNTSSMGGKMYTPLGAWYHATKYALEAWSDCLRLEVAQFGIDVVIIEPGIIATEFGSVMFDPMVARSADGPYAQMANAVASATKKSYEKGQSSHPSVIAAVVAKAINSKYPDTRYVAGKLAKQLIFMRKWLSDRIYDKLIMSQIK